MPQTQAQQILAIVHSLKNRSLSLGALPLDFAANNSAQLQKIQQQIQFGLPIEMVLPAFPAKSANPLKTHGHLPCLGEVLGLQRLNSLCLEISKIYSPGATVIVCSDGRVFSDLVQVTDSHVSQYSEGIQKIIFENGFSFLRTFNLEDVLSSQNTFTEMRELLVQKYAEPIDIIRERVKTQEESKLLFNGIHRFVFEDLLALFPDTSRNQIRERAKQLAYGVIQRSNAWSKLVEEQFPLALRLSIHPQPDVSSKIGISLLPSDDAWRTPWHSVAYHNGERFVLMKRKDVLAQGGELAFFRGKYPFYHTAQVPLQDWKASHGLFAAE